MNEHEWATALREFKRTHALFWHEHCCSLKSDYYIGHGDAPSATLGLLFVQHRIQLVCREDGATIPVGGVPRRMLTIEFKITWSTMVRPLGVPPFYVREWGQEKFTRYLRMRLLRCIAKILAEARARNMRDGLKKNPWSEEFGAINGLDPESALQQMFPGGAIEYSEPYYFECPNCGSAWFGTNPLCQTCCAKIKRKA